MWKTFALIFVGTGVFLMTSLISAKDDKGPSVKAQVYVHPKKLTAEDKLSFGPDSDQKLLIPIKGETTLVYIDLAPDARFAHPTQCVLISADGTCVMNGNWWLVLNGNPLFREAKISQVGFPINLSRK